MEFIDVKNEDVLTIGLKGHIDSTNADKVEAEINEARLGNEEKHLVIDAQNLEYISSAGLRVILRLKKADNELKIINTSSEVYEIFDITGFTEMMNVEKAYRQVSVDGCEVIGQGANGIVYRIDPDTIVKMYYDTNALHEIQRERELARTALILGIPTAIPYDVVRVGDGYGSVYELLNATSFAKMLINDPSKLNEVAHMSVDLLKKIHGTLVKPGVMPNEKEIVLNWAKFLKDYLPQEAYDKLYRLIDEVPEDTHMLHGDYHIKNVMMQNDEVLLIDMDTLCVGNPIFEFGSIYNAYQGYSELDHENIKNFLGITFEMGKEFWDKTLHLYFDDKSEEEIQDIANRAMLLGHTRIMRRTIRRNGFDTEEGRAIIENSKSKILEFLEKINTLAI